MPDEGCGVTPSSRVSPRCIWDDGFSASAAGSWRGGTRAIAFPGLPSPLPLSRPGEGFPSPQFWLFRPQARQMHWCAADPTLHPHSRCRFRRNPMSDRDSEANRFSARAARYARVGANVGGVAARIAGTRLFGLEGRNALQCRGAGQGAGRAEGPDHEGGAAHRHHSRRRAAGIRRRTAEAAIAGAADGRGLRQAPDDGRARPAMARALRRVRPEAGRGGLARPGASRDDALMACRSPASCNIPTWNRRSRPISPSSTSCSRCTGAWSR